MRLPLSFYQDLDVVQISQNLLGKVLVTEVSPGERTSGIIVETEAYRAPEDKASHAYGNRRTPRTETMFSSGGVAYVYLCYGMHHLFNVVTGPQNVPHAVLIRSIEPLEGIDLMITRRKKKSKDYSLTKGPGCLSQALGIHKKHNHTKLTENTIWIEDRNIHINSKNILATPRIGVSYAGKDAKLPWRFSLNKNPWVSVGF